MGWYHYELANGQDPSSSAATVDNNTNTTTTTCTTGTCTSSASNNNGRHNGTAVSVSNNNCPDGTCSTLKTPGTSNATTEACCSNNTTITIASSTTTITATSSINEEEDAIITNNNNDNNTTLMNNNNTTTIPKSTTTTTTTTNYNVDRTYEPEIYRDNGSIYHLCDEANWLSAIRIQRAYYPPTYWRDGKFTRGCCQRETLVPTGNEYYKISSGRWIALEIDATKLHEAGITIECHRAPESKRNNDEDEPIQCLKIYSGITTTLPGFITNIYKMHRTADGTFVGMTLDEMNTIPRTAAVVLPQSSAPKITTTTSSTSKEETAPSTTTKVNKDNTKNKSSTTTVTSKDDNDTGTKKRTGLLWMRTSRRKSNQ